MQALLNTIRAIVVQEVRRVLSAQGPAKRYGNVVQWDPKKHAAKVRIQPEGIVTNWIPVSSEFIGNGFGVVAALGADDQVEIHWPEDGINEASITRRLFDARNAVPDWAQNAQPGEYYLGDKAGSLLSMTLDGKFTLAGKAEIDLVGAPTINVGDGNATVINVGTAGSVTLNMGASGATVNIVGGSGDVKVNGVSLVNHTHSGVASGAGNTGAPNKS